MVFGGTVSRRQFLATGSAALGALALPPALAEQATPLAAATGPDRWQVLARILGDGLTRPTDSDYDGAAMPNNLRFAEVRPAGIAYCRTPEMVADTVKWCRDYDMPFAIRGGGHSYSGFSTSHDLIIDMRDMDTITADAATGRVTIGAGVINGNLYEALDANGRMITHGRCPTVGAGGFLLGGGIGFNMRRLGMGCDAVLSAEIVTADGEIRQLSDEQDPDLFWAIRGGAGGNFGVSTAFTLNTHPADAAMTVFRIVWRRNVLGIATALFEVADTAPHGLGTRISLGGVTPTTGARGRQVPLTLLGQYAGSKDEFLALIAPVLAVGAPDFSDIQERSYWDGQAFLADAGEPAWFRERSAFLGTAPSRDFLAAGIDAMASWPGTGAAANLVFFQTGGRINEIAADATAFVHRDSHWLNVVNLSWSEDDLSRPHVVRHAMDWQDALYGEVNGGGGGRAFQNFPDASLVDWRQRYYGANLPRLEAVKAKYDPTNLFRYGQSI